MTVEEMKDWARENNAVGLVAELVKNGVRLEKALHVVYDMKMLSKKDFVMKYFG